MADNPTNWSALGSVAHVLTGAELQNQTNTQIVTGATVVDNSAGKLYGYFQLIIEPAGTDDWHAGDTVLLWFVKAIDGTNYETVSTSVYLARPADVNFPLAVALGGAHVVNTITIGPILLPPCKFKVACANRASHNFKDDTGNSVDLYTVTPNLVSA